MKNIKLYCIKLFLLSVTMVLASANIFAQASISGTICDDSGMSVIGATVTVLNSDISTVTDSDGHFNIADLPSGTYTIVCKSPIFKEKRVGGIHLTEKANVQLDTISLTINPIMIDQVTVTARQFHNSIIAIQSLKKSSFKTLDAISSELISRRGDGTAAAAMKRVTGVSVIDGRYIYIRGLGNRYTRTTLNTAGIPGLNPNKNTIQMDIFPSRLIDNIIVYKNFSPELPGNFSGGLINITTKDFPEKEIFRASLGISYNPQVNLNPSFLTYRGSATDWLAYDNGLRNLPTALQHLPSYTEALSNKKSADQLRSTILDLNENLVPYRTVKPLNYKVGLSYGNNIRFLSKDFGYLIGLHYGRNYSGYKNGSTARQSLTIPGADQLVIHRNLIDNYYSDEVLIGGLINTSIRFNDKHRLSLRLMHNRTGTSSTRYQEGLVLAISGDTYQERTLNYAARSLSTVQLQGQHQITKNTEIKWISSFSQARLDQPDLRFINNVYNIHENTGDTTYFIDASEDRLPTRFYRSMQESHSDNQLNMITSIQSGNRGDITLKYGLAYVHKSRKFRDSLFMYSEGGNAADFSDYITPNNAFSSENPGGVYIFSGTEDRNQYNSRMQIFSTYGMAQIPLSDRLKAMVGARIEFTRLDFQSFVKKFDGNQVPEERLLHQYDILPAISLIYELIPDKMNLRINAASTVARPSFREISSIAMFEPIRNVIIMGNEDLKITNIINTDIRWEYFIGSEELLSLSAFYKHFKNPIELVIDPKSDKQLNYMNVESGEVYGMEIELRKKLDFIPYGKNFTLGANYTYVYSAVAIPEEELEKKRRLDPDFPAIRPMYGQSPYIVNAFISYKNEKTELSLSYNVQGPRLLIVSYDNTPDLYEQAFHSLNCKLSHKLSNGWAISLGIKNILNDVREEAQIYLGRKYTYHAYRAGRTYCVGLNYSLE